MQIFHKVPSLKCISLPLPCGSSAVFFLKKIHIYRRLQIYWQLLKKLICNIEVVCKKRRVFVSWLWVMITRRSQNRFSAIFINLAPVFDDTTYNFILFFLYYFSCNQRLQLVLSKILMKWMKTVWHCRRLHQFILIDWCDLIPAFRLVKIGFRLSKMAQQIANWSHISQSKIKPVEHPTNHLCACIMPPWYTSNCARVDSRNVSLGIPSGLQSWGNRNDSMVFSSAFSSWYSHSVYLYHHCLCACKPYSILVN